MLVSCVGLAKWYLGFLFTSIFDRLANMNSIFFTSVLLQPRWFHLDPYDEIAGLIALLQQ